MSLIGRHIIVGVTGGIAAYKSAELVRLLVKAGAEVQVVMTPAATEFVGPMTFQALSGRPVRTALFDVEHEAAMGHIELARWADLVVIAPATADIIARLAHGEADDLLTTLALATPSPVAIVPAMNQQMWASPSTQANIERVRRHGFPVWGPATGEQACGDTGPGRMIEPAEIFSLVNTHFPARLFDGVRIMVTAGPTFEPIDPVRFIGNRSSGLMGYSIAQAFAEQGASVTLVSGPVRLEEPSGVECIRVETATQMHEAVMQRITDQQLFVATAAVADYRPLETVEQKIKKDAESLQVTLVRNPDILAEVAALADAPFTVGFAAETGDVLAYADKKRVAKDLDMIAANLVGTESGGFDTPDNALTVLWEGGQAELPLMEKLRLARQLIELIKERFDARTGTENP